MSKPTPMKIEFQNFSLKPTDQLREQGYTLPQADGRKLDKLHKYIVELYINNILVGPALEATKERFIQLAKQLSTKKKQ